MARAGWRRGLGRGLGYCLGNFIPATEAFLQPDRILIGAKAAQSYALDWASPADVETQFSRAIDGLLDILSQRQWRGRRLRLLSSEYWSRSLLLPLPGKAPTDDELDRLVGIEFERIYGKSMESWAWRWDRGVGQAYALAWPQAPLERLRRGLVDLDGRLTVAAPVAAHVLRDAPDAGAAGWRMLLENSCVTLARYADRRILAWRTLPLEQGIGAMQALDYSLQCLAREQARLDDSCNEVLLFDLRSDTPGESGRSVLFQAAPWRIRRVAPSPRGFEILAAQVTASARDPRIRADRP